MMLFKRFLSFFLFGICIISIIQCNPQANIMESNDIKEIETYLATAHPEDSKRRPLQSKLIALKNEDWVKGAKDAKPMAARPVASEVPKRISNVGYAFHNKEEYEKLLLETPSEHHKKTLHLLNTIFNTDISNNEAILLFQNNSECNIILRIKGENLYNLAIPTRSENSVIVKKGQYAIEGYVCDVKYSSNKNVTTSQVIAINNANASAIIEKVEQVSIPKKVKKPVKKRVNKK